MIDWCQSKNCSICITNFWTVAIQMHHKAKCTRSPRHTCIHRQSVFVSYGVYIVTIVYRSFVACLYFMLYSLCCFGSSDPENIDQSAVFSLWIVFPAPPPPPPPTLPVLKHTAEKHFLLCGAGNSAVILCSMYNYGLWCVRLYYMTMYSAVRILLVSKYVT